MNNGSMTKSTRVRFCPTVLIETQPGDLAPLSHQPTDVLGRAIRLVGLPSDRCPRFHPTARKAGRPLAFDNSLILLIYFLILVWFSLPE